MRVLANRITRQYFIANWLILSLIEDEGHDVQDKGKSDCGAVTYPGGLFIALWAVADATLPSDTSGDYRYILSAIFIAGMSKEYGRYMVASGRSNTPTARARSVRSREVLYQLSYGCIGKLTLLRF